MVELNKDKVEAITLYTGTKGYHNCYCKCPCCTQRNINDSYQGSISQIEELLNNFPYLKQLYILGNPDPLVDATFCNQASKTAIAKNINVCYSTSGVGGIQRLKQLIEGINPSFVDYISFSMDTTSKEKMSALKGINYPYDKVIEEIKWAIKNNYLVKIQPTLWSSNYMDTYKIIEYFANLGINLFTFHIGSNETNTTNNNLHLTESEVKYVHELIEKAVSKYNVQVTCPVIYPSRAENDQNKWYCMNPSKCRELLVFLRENGIYVTNVPILSEIDEKYCYSLDQPVFLNELEHDEVCPASNDTAKTKTLCRYVKRKWN